VGRGVCKTLRIQRIHSWEHAKICLTIRGMNFGWVFSKIKSNSGEQMAKKGVCTQNECLCSIAAKGCSTSLRMDAHGWYVSEKCTPPRQRLPKSEQLTDLRMSFAARRRFARVADGLWCGKNRESRETPAPLPATGNIVVKFFEKRNGGLPVNRITSEFISWESRWLHMQIVSSAVSDSYGSLSLRVKAIS